MKILAVDDNQDNLYLLQALLPAHGHQVVTASDGVAALEKLAQEPFHLIISDILMPRMDGFQLCRELKSHEQWKSIPFIFYTATYTEVSDEEFALSLGANRFVVKPKDPEIFARIVEEAIANPAAQSQDGPLPVETEEAVYLKQYNQRLINKIEDKMVQLEASSRRLAERESYLQSIFETEPECIKILAASGTLNEINPAGLRMIEAESAEQAMGLSFEGLVATEYRAEFRALTAKILLGEEGTLEYPIIGLKGTHRWCETHATGLKDNTGKITAILGITRDISERKANEQKNQQYVEQLRALGHRILNAKEDEAKRISRELHDEAGQLLSGIHIELGKLLRTVPSENRAAVQEIIQYLAQVEEQVRSIAHNLRPPALDLLGLAPALENLARLTIERFGLQVDVATSLVTRMAPDIELTIYRTVQEALNNITKHANASSVTVQVRQETGSVYCTIKDNGRGFDPGDALTSSQSDGLGIVGIRERLQGLGGDLRIESSIGQGTALIATIPIK